jgi:hypothetical protein
MGVHSRSVLEPDPGGEQMSTVDDADSLKALAAAMPAAHRDLITARTRAEFDDALAAIVQESIQSLQRSSRELAPLGENGLSTVLAMALNSTEALKVTREENSNGHADFTFRAPLCRPPRVTLGEAKIFECYSYHEKGLQQLMRYCTGTEGRALLIVYVKKPDIEGHFARLRNRMDEQCPCSQEGVCLEHSAHWSFLSIHKHSSGRQIEVWHVGCNLNHV